MISKRYLFERRGERFISVSSFISMLGIAVGVAALIVTMAVINGFNNEIEEKILNVNPHVIVTKTSPIRDRDIVLDNLLKIDGVVGGAAFLDGQALISSNDKMMGILLRGINRDPNKRLIKMENYLKKGTLTLDNNRAIIGSELASHFRLGVNDKFSIVSPLHNETKEFIVSGIFNSGRYDYDLNLIFCSIEEVAALFAMEGAVTGIGLKIEDVFNAENVKRDVRANLRGPYKILTWKDLDRNLFSALKLEKIVMFLVVALIVFVACFNIIGTLIMTVMEKTKDIGILKAIGATRLGIMAVFFFEGIYVSLIGIGIGSALGLGIAYLQQKYELIKLPPDIYYIYSVPVQIKLGDTIFIIAAAFILGLVAAIYPSLHAGRLSPVDALRYEG